MRARVECADRFERAITRIGASTAKRQRRRRVERALLALGWTRGRGTKPWLRLHSRGRVRRSSHHALILEPCCLKSREGSLAPRAHRWRARLPPCRSRAASSSPRRRNRACLRRVSRGQPPLEDLRPTDSCTLRASTSRPSDESSTAAARPAIPAPMTSTSAWNGCFATCDRYRRGSSSRA